MARADERLIGRGLTELVPASWRDALSSVIFSREFAELEAFLEGEWRSGEVFPPRGEVFAALSATSLDMVKVVVLGQDPYHGPGEAHGLAFSVRAGVRIPPSLRNIFKELEADLGFPAPSSGDLTSWAEKGVLLLNTVLTVRRGEPNSHAGKGWEAFTDAVVETVSARGGAVFLLWGRNAAAKRCLIDESENVVLESPHPSPFSARKGFFGSRPFSKANAALAEMGEGPVDWDLARDYMIEPLLFDA